MILKQNDENIEYRNEYDLLVDVYYKGIPFSGKIIDELEEIEYKNGKVNGDYIVRYPSGIIKEHELYENGVFIEGKHFYPNGLKLYESTKESYKRWNLSQNVISEYKDQIHYEYFKEGFIKSISPNIKEQDWAIKFFSKNEELIYTQMIDKVIDGELKRIITYDNDLMYKYYFDLLNFENPELKDNQTYSTTENHRIHHIWMWFWKVFDFDAEMYLNILNSLLKHPNIDVKKTIANIIAHHRLHIYIEKESEETIEAYNYIRESSSNLDKNFPSREIRNFKTK